MADSEQSAQERTLEPTAKRLQDARREGQIPRSRELAHLLVLGAGAGVLFRERPAIPPCLSLSLG